jgi:hypothetical protein
MGLLPLNSETGATSIHFSLLAEIVGRKKRSAAVATVANIPPIAARGRSKTNARRDLLVSVLDCLLFCWDIIRDLFSSNGSTSKAPHGTARLERSACQQSAQSAKELAIAYIRNKRLDPMRFCVRNEHPAKEKTAVKTPAGPRRQPCSVAITPETRQNTCARQQSTLLLTKQILSTVLEVTANEYE